MKAIIDSIRDARYKLAAVFALILASAFGLVDPAAAGMGAILIGDIEPGSIKALEKAVKEAMDNLGVGIKKAQDTADAALEEVRKEGTVHGQTADALKKVGEDNVKAQADLKKLQDRLLELEQKASKRIAELEVGAAPMETAGKLFTGSDAYKEMIKGKLKNSDTVEISRKAILTTSFTNDQPLVQADRRPGIVTPPQRRLFIRDLLPQIPTDSNVVEYAKELVFTNAAAPQYDATSPDPHAEGAAKAESNITFELANAVVITLAHWIAASRQILADAPALAGYIDSRLGYGLKLEEEDELLNADGTAGQLNGLVNQATAFNGGGTNQTALDTILRAFLQVTLADYEASGIILHPYDWTGIMLAKDTTGRYLFSDPHSAELPRVWGKTVVPTASMTQGSFLCGAFDLGAAIYDREGMTIRVAEQHQDFFVKNLVAILCEERLTFVMYRPAAFVTGSILTPG